MSNQAENREKGNKSEDIAEEFIAKLGFTIKKRNFHFGKLGELDIIAQKGDLLVFFEVRSRYSANSMDPLLTLNPKKRMNLRKTAEGYLYVNKIENLDCRMDFIKIDMFYNPPQIIHIENAF